MIDAIFFLLVFFMFSSLSMVKMNGLPLTLPKAPPEAGGGGAGAAGRGAASSAPAAPPQRVVLAVGAGGALSLDGAPAGGDARALAAALTTRLAAKPGAVVLVRAETGATVQRLVDVMDALGSVRLPSGKAPTVLVATPTVTPSDRTSVVPPTGVGNGGGR